MKKKNLLLVYVGLFGIVLSFTSCEEGEFLDDPITNDQRQNDDPNNGTTTDISQNDYVALYEISQDQIIKINDGFDGEDWMFDDTKHQEMWDLVVQLIDAGDRPWIKQFVVIDGQGELFGYVEPLRDDLNQWRM